MIGTLRIIAAIVRKDLAVLWPLAALVVLMPVLRTDAVLQAIQNDNLRAGTIVVSLLAVGLLILGVMHQDASASLRHDWLIRPIPRWTLVAAKLVFIALIVFVPARVTAFVSALADGLSIGEVLARATSIGLPALAGILAVIVFGAVTSTLLEAAGALLAFAVVVFLAQAVSGSVLADAKGATVAGAEWLFAAPAFCLLIGLAAPVLWLQYERRRTVLARAIVGAACIGALAPVLTPPSAMFSLLKLLTPGADTRGAAVALAPGCFARIPIDAESDVVPNEAQRRWNGDQLAKAGPRAIGFATTVAPTALPRGWKTMIGYAEASYIDAEGKTVHRLQGSSSAFGRDSVDASESATHFWLASRDGYEEAAGRSARLRLTYFVSTLEPVASAEMDVGGRRRYLRGFGYCSAARGASPDAVSLDCFLRGRRPALVTATWAGVTGARETPTGPDYAPAALEILTGAPYRLRLPPFPDGSEPRARLTAYEARKHVNMSVEAAGLLGGTSCSTLSASERTPAGEQP